MSNHGVRENHASLEDLLKLLEEARQQHPAELDILRQSAFAYLASGVRFRGKKGKSGDQMLEIPFFEMREREPYILYDLDQIKELHKCDEIKYVSKEEDLERAEELFANLAKLDTARPEGEMGRGIVLLLKGLMKINFDESANVKGLSEDGKKSLVDAAAAFDAARMISEDTGPAYFYAALADFLLLDTDRGKKENDDKIGMAIRQRQAFYRLEHFIDLKLERIVEYSNQNDDEEGISNKALEIFDRCREAGGGFYFNGNEIKLVLNDKYSRLAELEELFGLMPVCRSFLRIGRRQRKVGEIVKIVCRNVKKEMLRSDEQKQR